VTKVVVSHVALKATVNMLVGLEEGSSSSSSSNSSETSTRVSGGTSRSGDVLHSMLQAMNALPGLKHTLLRWRKSRLFVHSMLAAQLPSQASSAAHLEVHACVIDQHVQGQAQLVELISKAPAAPHSSSEAIVCC
jgi:hypothetical protein